MTTTQIAIANGILAVLLLGVLGAVVALGLRVDRTTNEESLVPAAPTPLGLHDEELAEAA
jgi:hypothetical protein